MVSNITARQEGLKTACREREREVYDSQAYREELRDATEDHDDANAKVDDAAGIIVSKRAVRFRAESMFCFPPSSFPSWRKKAHKMLEKSIAAVGWIVRDKARERNESMAAVSGLRDG